nr:hypothetical protein [Tanacetum cinerariifolium]
MAAFLSKSDASEGFDQIVDFLNAHTIKYALVVNPTIYISCIKQFWATTTVKKVNDDVQLHTLTDGKKVAASEAIIRRDLYLDDADGVECLPNDEIFEELCLSAKRTAWNEFSCSMASAVICLATSKKFNFSKYIFDSMVRNVDSPSKFLMYLHFLQAVLDHQVDDLTTHNTRYTSPALTQKVFANMRRVRKGFSGVKTPLFDSMLVQPQPQAEEGVEILITPAPPSITSAPSPTDLQDPTPTPHATPPTPHDSPPQDQPLHHMNLLCHSAVPSKDKEKALWVELKRLFELDADDVLWKLQRHMHAPLTWKLYGDYGVHHVSSTRGHAIFMLTDKDYLLSNTVMILMLSGKLQVEKDNEMTRDLVMKIFMEANKPRSKMLLDKVDAAAGVLKIYSKGMTYDKVRPIFEREYKKESFKKLRAAEISGSESTQEIPSNDLKEISEEDVQNMLEIVPIPKIKVEALQVKYPIIDWEIHTE